MQSLLLSERLKSIFRLCIHGEIVFILQSGMKLILYSCFLLIYTDNLFLPLYDFEKNIFPLLTWKASTDMRVDYIFRSQYSRDVSLARETSSLLQNNYSVFSAVVCHQHCSVLKVWVSGFLLLCFYIEIKDNSKSD